jgi:hypothetical protein
MKKGVYLNLRDDNVELIYYNGDNIEMRDSLSLYSFDLDFEIKDDLQTFELTFRQLEYLGIL